MRKKRTSDPPAASATAFERRQHVAHAPRTALGSEAAARPLNSVGRGVVPVADAAGGPMGFGEAGALARTATRRVLQEPPAVPGASLAAFLAEADAINPDVPVEVEPPRAERPSSPDWLRMLPGAVELGPPKLPMFEGESRFLAVPRTGSDSVPSSRPRVLGRKISMSPVVFSLLPRPRRPEQEGRLGKRRWLVGGALGSIVAFVAIGSWWVSRDRASETAVAAELAEIHEPLAASLPRGPKPGEPPELDTAPPSGDSESLSETIAAGFPTDPEPVAQAEERVAFDVRAAKATMTDAARRIENCGYPGGPHGAGLAHVIFAPNGSIAVVKVITPQFNEPRILECIRDQMFQSSGIAPFSGEPVTAKKSFRIPRR